MVKLPHWPSVNERTRISPGLDTTLQLLQKLDNPHLKLPPTIHIAGTNGKGSTLAFLESIFKEANYKVHKYTSPHLIRFNERIKLASNEISDNELYLLIEEVRLASLSLDIQPTFFEATTVAAFLGFSRHDADILLLETGLGGELDSTNVITDPILTIISSISFDHQNILGTSLSQIATAKSGIIKYNAPCIISNQYPETLEILSTKAKSKKVKTSIFEYDWGITPKDQGFIYRSKDYIIEINELGLKGFHQFINAANAIAAIRELKNFSITDHNIINGIKHTTWPARLEKITNKKLTSLVPKNCDIYLDGAHNEASAFVLSKWLQTQNHSSIYMILGMTQGKDIEKFITQFKSKNIKKIYTVNICSEPLSYNSTYLKDKLGALDIKADACNNIKEALTKISCSLTDNKNIIIICGSLFLASDIYYTITN